MSAGPDLPSTRHVWINTHGRYGPPAAGVIVSWHPQIGSDGVWLALVAVQRAPENLSIDWVPADLLDPITDPTPANWTPARRGVRHVWRGPIYDRGAPAPALLIGKRRTEQGEWQAQLAIVNTDAGTVLVNWEPPGQVRPVLDDTIARSAGDMRRVSSLRLS